MPNEKQIQAWPLYGYAPGMYSFPCSECGKISLGDKRSIHCLECAVTQAKKALTAAEQAEPAPAARSGAVKVVEDTYERYPKIMDRLTALEPAEPATDAEPVAFLRYHSDSIGICFPNDPGAFPVFRLTHPPESRLREAFARHAEAWSNILELNLIPERYRSTAIELRDHAHALAQGADDERS